jgi:hypothetical protein
VSYDTGIADRLRAAGIRVIEIAGWQTRGSSSFGPGGSVNHHTAGGASGATPSLNICINGRSDLPGPLCNVMQSREPGYDDIAYVIAAGRANHAGSGGYKGLSGNSSVYGLEIEHTGVDPLPMQRQEIAARIHAAMWEGDPQMVCQHREWTSRKIDAAENVDANGFRQLVAEAKLGGGYDDLPTPSDVWSFKIADETGNARQTLEDARQIARRAEIAADEAPGATWKIKVSDDYGDAKTTLRDTRTIARRAEQKAEAAQKAAEECLAILKGTR